MQRRTLFHIVPEGWLLMATLAVLCLPVGLLLGVWAAIPPLGAIIVCILFFRDAPRRIVAQPRTVVAPADGVIIHRRECHDPYLDREAIKVIIRVNPFGAYFLRSPMEGAVLELDRQLLEENGRPASLIRSDHGGHLVMVVKQGRLFGADPCMKGYGERVGQGRCCGYRRLARQLALLLPVNARMEVAPGDRVRAGKTVLARFVNREPGMQQDARWL